MKTSMLLVAAGAVLAVATPLKMEKRKMETKVVIEWVTETVTEGALNTFYAAGVNHHHPPPTPTTSSTSSTSTPEPATVAPTTTEAPPPPPPETTTAPEVVPDTNVAPTTEQPAPAVQTADEAPAQAPPASSTQQAAPAAPTDYASTAVYHHNVHRANHSAPAISWSDTLAGYAAETAAKCVFAHDMTPGGGGYGQNLAVWGASGDVRAQLSQQLAVAQAITDMWYKGELPNWPAADYGMPTPDMSNFDNWGHLTQVLWVASIEVGCATQYCDVGTIFPDMQSVFTVCDYSPAGNVGGQYGQNMLPPLGLADISV